MCAVLGILSSLIFPWATIPLFGSVSGSEGDGYFSAIFCVIAIVMVLRGDKQSALDKNSGMIAGVMGVLTLGWGIWKLMQMNSATSELGALGESMVSTGWGLYALIVAGAGIAYAGLMMKERTAATAS